MHTLARFEPLFMRAATGQSFRNLAGQTWRVTAVINKSAAFPKGLIVLAQNGKTATVDWPTFRQCFGR